MRLKLFYHMKTFLYVKSIYQTMTKHKCSFGLEV